MKNPKVMIPLVLLVALGGVYKFVIAKPKPAPPSKVHGEVYVLPKEFLVNLADGRFAKLSVALVVAHGSAAPAAGGHGAPAKPPEGYGIHPQEGLVRTVVTDTLTGRPGDELIERKGRHELQERIAKRLLRSTDVKVEEVLFTDLAVQ